jgi:hypothetical protein
MEGYIKLHRGLLDSEVFASESALKIWIWLLLKATYKERFVTLNIGKGEVVIKLERGQLIFGRKMAETALLINESSVRRKINMFSSRGMIDVKSTNHYSIITICNYDIYNDTENENDQQTTSRRPADDQQVTTYKKDKKDKKEKNNIFSDLILQNGANEGLLKDWMLIRKSKKCVDTETSAKMFLKQVKKSDININLILEKCINKNWASFESCYLDSDKPKFNMTDFLKNK